MNAWLTPLGGGVLLYFGAEWFVGGASALALAARIPQLIVGLTVVAYGTSAPEVIVGIEAARAGHGEVKARVAAGPEGDHFHRITGDPHAHPAAPLLASRSRAQGGSMAAKPANAVSESLTRPSTAPCSKPPVRRP